MASHEAGARSWAQDITSYLIYIILITTIGPLQFGFHLAELNAPQAVIICEKKAISTASAPSLPQCIPMTPAQFGLVSSIFTLGGLIGALAAGPCSTKYGRLLTMRFTTIFFTVGPLFEALAPNIPTMSIGRFLSGLGAGAAIVVVPIYISEIAPPKEKGLFGALTQVMINLGILLAQSLGYFLSRDQLWRVILAVGGCIGFSQLLGLLGVVESPKWSAAHGKPQTAKRNLKKIRGTFVNIEDEVDDWNVDERDFAGRMESFIVSHGSCNYELEHIFQRNADEKPAAAEEEGLLGDPDAPSANSSTTLASKHSAKESTVGIFEVVRNPIYRPAIVAVVGVMLAQQLCGINSIVMYSVSLLSTLLPTTSALLTVIVAAINLIVTLLCAPLADRLGRKACLLLSIAGMGTNSLLLAISLLYSIKPLSAIAMLLFVASFAVGLGPVPFILASELVGQEAVGAAQSWALAANWIATFVVAQFFPVLNESLGKGKVYFVFMGLAAMFFVFVVWAVPETKGKRDADDVWGRERRVD
ncbi:MAG: hypothetical protein M1837_003957 [Sclerophora amabilis]|nr:MAG: hypothetical protein M1837_003957 [Sclerophora amabilis]